MPRQIAKNDEMPRRRRGAAAVAIEAETERGLAMRILLHSPKDMVAGALAFAAVSAIVANALFLQAGRHPSPMFGTGVAIPAPGLTSPLPRPRPPEAALFEPKLAEPKPVEARLAEPKHTDPMTNLVKATIATPAASPAVPRPPAPVPVSSRNDAGPASGSRRVASVQRALTEYGYGQLKPTGTVGSDTQAAIQKFERERKIPVTGILRSRSNLWIAAWVSEPTVPVGFNWP